MKPTHPLFAAAALLAALLTACGSPAASSQSPAAPQAAPPPSAQEAYAAFLAGDRTRLADPERWWVPDFGQDGLCYEYACLDLDGDGGQELVIQMVQDPSGYNGVFHWAEGQLHCWNSDGAEGSCRDHPLADGTMVRQMDFNGTTHYTLFRYESSGSTTELGDLFTRQERIPEDSPLPCPYYEADGTALTQEEFARQLDERVTQQLLPRSAWTALPAAPAPAS